VIGTEADQDGTLLHLPPLNAAGIGLKGMVAMQGFAIAF